MFTLFLKLEIKRNEDVKNPATVVMDLMEQKPAVELHTLLLSY